MGSAAALLFSFALAAEAVRVRAPTPQRIYKTENYREASALSLKLTSHQPSSPKRVAVIGGGLSGLACAKYLADAGHKPTVYEARKVLGGKVSAWQDDDGDWIETGLHIFFGAYPNMMNLFAELGIEDRLQWKEHKMTFAMQEKPGEFTSFNFPPNVPAPFNMAVAILSNTEMLTFEEKIRMVPGLLPMMLEGQSFIDAQDELSVLEFMEKYGMPRRINEEIFIAMGKALDFLDPDRLSMTVVLTAMNRFINEADGSQTAFLDGNQPDRLCAPIVDHVAARGGAVKTGCALKEIEIDEVTGEVAKLHLANGETVRKPARVRLLTVAATGEALMPSMAAGSPLASLVASLLAAHLLNDTPLDTQVEADMYVSAMPVDVFKRLCPAKWAAEPFFAQLKGLEGVPVITVQLWFDRKLNSVDGLCFSRSPLLSVYADMSTCVEEYASDKESMVELVFAPATVATGAEVNWISKSDEEIVDATLGELARLFPTEIANDERWPATSTQGAAGKAKLRKHAVVRVPRSVYAATPGRNAYRPSQETPISNFVLAGDYTSQKFLGSMEGAVLAGKLAAEVVVDKAAGQPTRGIKSPSAHIVPNVAAPAPVGVHGDYPIAFGGGQQGVGSQCSHP